MRHSGRGCGTRISEESHLKPKPMTPTDPTQFTVARLQKRPASSHIADIGDAAALAQVPDSHDFVTAFAELLKPEGVATFGFPHLLRLIGETRFDTLYHEHYSCLSLGALGSSLAASGLAVYDVEDLPPHGGSPRFRAQGSDGGSQACSLRVAALLARRTPPACGMAACTPVSWAG